MPDTPLWETEVWDPHRSADISIPYLGRGGTRTRGLERKRHMRSGVTRHSAVTGFQESSCVTMRELFEIPHGEPCGKSPLRDSASTHGGATFFKLTPSFFPKGRSVGKPRGRGGGAGTRVPHTQFCETTQWGNPPSAIASFH